MKTVLVLYYSRNGATANLAEEVAHGVNGVEHASARLRRVPPIETLIDKGEDHQPQDGALYCEIDDLAGCDALCLGSPTRFGNMAAPMKHFWDKTGGLWATGRLVDKPAAVFTSSSSMHGGNESTLLTMMVPLLHHGMLVQGVPYTCNALGSTRFGGTPYGASHVEQGNEGQLTPDEKAIARFLGERIAKLAVRLG